MNITLHKLARALNILKRVVPNPIMDREK